MKEYLKLPSLTETKNIIKRWKNEGKKMKKKDEEKTKTKQGEKIIIIKTERRRKNTHVLFDEFSCCYT